MGRGTFLDQNHGNPPTFASKESKISNKILSSSFRLCVWSWKEQVPVAPEADVPQSPQSHGTVECTELKQRK